MKNEVVLPAHCPATVIRTENKGEEARWFSPWHEAKYKKLKLFRIFYRYRINECLSKKKTFKKL